MLRSLLLVLAFALITGNDAYSLSRNEKSLVSRALDKINAPVLHTFRAPLVDNTASVFGPDHFLYGRFDIPQFRKYQNSHIAPTRIYVGSGLVAAGGAMLIAGYRQDTKYEWSGPYMSTSPLNVFGILIAVVGLVFIASGLIFYSKYKKHTIAPYNKSY